MPFGITASNLDLCHRARLKAENQISFHFRNPVPDPSRHDKRIVVQDHADRTVATRHNRDSENLDPIPYFMPFFRPGIAREKFTDRIIRHAGKDRHPVSTFYPFTGHIIDAEVFGIIIL